MDQIKGPNALPIQIFMGPLFIYSRAYKYEKILSIKHRFLEIYYPLRNKVKIC